MKLMPCPLNGPRNISEFVCYGEVVSMPDPNQTDDLAWADYIWNSNNTAGMVREWWCHVATAYWFIAERNTITDEIVKTYPSSKLYQDRQEFEST